MQERFPAPVEKLIGQFAKLPGVGRKSAQRMAYFVLSLPEEEAYGFADAITQAKERIILCPVCQNFTDSTVCDICTSDKRDAGTICVVSEPRDVAAIERTREYKGLYHVLHGVISPRGGVSPDDIRINELLQRINGNVAEVIMATNPDTEGDTTALYIARLLRPYNVKVTRLAYGIPIGGHLEFADEATLQRSLEGRRTIG